MTDNHLHGLLYLSYKTTYFVVLANATLRVLRLLCIMWCCVVDWISLIQFLEFFVSMSCYSGSTTQILLSSTICLWPAKRAEFCLSF
ncbi:hypothetical protein LINPERPRIM_LOCUS27410 [Linum perenne]